MRLWAKSLLNAVLFFAVFMVALPWLADVLLPAALPIPAAPRVGVVLFVVGVAVWVARSPD